MCQTNIARNDGGPGVPLPGPTVRLPVRFPANMRSIYFQNRDQTIRQNLPNYQPDQTLDYEQMLQQSGGSTPAPSSATG